MRSTYWDSIKGFAIIAVVIIHACGHTTLFPEGSPNWIFGIFIKQIVNFAVPMFFALSGFFSPPRVGVTPFQYISNRLIRIVPPYLIWTLAYLVPWKPSHFQNPILLIHDFFLGTGIGNGYFVIVMLQFILLTPFIWKIKSVKTHVILMIFLSAVGLSVTYVLRAFCPSSAFSKFPFSGILFVYWYPFFHFGVFVSMFREATDKWLNKIKRVIPWLLFIFLLLSLVEGFFWSFRGISSIGASQIKLSSFALSLTLFLSVLAFPDRLSCIDKKILAWLGRGSYIIYLSHMFVLWRVGHVLAKSKMIFQIQPIFVSLVTVMTLILCSILILAIEHTPVRKLKKSLGL